MNDSKPSPPVPSEDVPPLGSLENPIPVCGVAGEFEYLCRLRSSSLQPFLFHRLGSCGRSNGMEPVDIYELVSQDAAEHWILAMSMYYRHGTGSKLEAVDSNYLNQPAHVLDSMLQMSGDRTRPAELTPTGLKFDRGPISRMTVLGTNARVNHFPFGLRAAIPLRNLRAHIRLAWVLLKTPRKAWLEAPVNRILATHPRGAW